MTQKPARYAPPSSQQLLGHILETPALVAAVRALPPRVLGKLIDHVGLEDSGELVALASTEQLRQIFDDDLWKSERPGKDESFDADRFALWLEVMLETGEDFAARKLAELPIDLVTLALHRHILVINADELSVEMADPTRDFTLLNKALDSCLYHEFAEYQVISRRQDGWDAIVNVLVALDKEHHDLLRRVLGRCCAMSSELIEENGGLQRVLTSEETLETDLAADREDRRAAQGFVAPSSAAAFLALARTTALADIEAQGRDPVARAYFRELDRKASAAGPAGRDSPRSAPLDGADPARDAEPLVEMLRHADVLAEARPRALLEAGTRAARVDPFGRALGALLQRAPDAHAARMAELAYLANVLIAGCAVAGRSFRPLEAAQAVVAVCNLGVSHLRGPSRGQSVDELAELLTAESADKLFRIGWQLLHQLSLDALRAVERLLSADGRRLPRGVIAALQSAARSGKPWLARRQLEHLDGVLDEQKLAAVRSLLDECPSLGGALRSEGEGAEVELIAGREQIDRARAFLGRLGASCRG